MRRPGEIVRHDPTALIRVRESHNRFAEQLPSLLEANVLLDYNPAVDLGSPGYTYGGSGAVTLGNRRGLPCAEYDGVSALYGPALFENLSDLTGGVSIYLMIEQDIKYAAGGAAGVFGQRRVAAATQRDCLGVYQVHVGTAFVGLVGDDAAASTPISYMSKKGVVFHSMHVTTAEVRVRNLHSGGNVAAAPTAPHDPSGMDQSVIGASAVFGAVNAWFTGAIYRIVVVEGAYDAALDAELQALYTPIPGLMFDFDPVRSLTEELFDRVALTDPIGGVALAASSTGAEGAAFDGTNYLTSLPPFETLAELNGGLTVYSVMQQDAAGSTSGYGGVWSIDRTAGATFADRLSVSRLDSNDTVYSYVHNSDATVAATHYYNAKVPRGVVAFHAAQYSATVRYAGLGGALTNSADFTSVSPVGMDRIVIGAASYGTAVDYYHSTGVTMRVLFCEGPYKQTVMDALISKYAPVRIPPGVRGADVISLFDPRQFHRSPELAQDYAEFGSGADQIVFGGMPCLKSLGVNSGMETPFSLFNKLSEFTGAALTVYAAIATPGAQTSGYVSAGGVIHNIGGDLRNGALTTAIRDIAGGGNSSSIWESAAPSVSVAEGSGHSGHPQGEIGVVATEFTLTTIEGYYNGVSNGPTAHAVDAGAYSEPTYHLVRVLFGGLGLVADACNLLYCVIVLGEYDAAVNAWIQTTFLQGTSP